MGDGGRELDVDGALAIIDLQAKRSSLVGGLASEGTGRLFPRAFDKGVEELPTFTRTCSTTLSSSRERGCSGSLMVLIRCDIS